MDYKCRETVIKNMKDIGCDEEIINAFLVCFDACDRKGQKKIMEDYRENILSQYHEKQRALDLIDYMMYQLDKCNCDKKEETL